MNVEQSRGLAPHVWGLVLVLLAGAALAAAIYYIMTDNYAKAAFWLAGSIGLRLDAHLIEWRARR